MHEEEEETSLWGEEDEDEKKTGDGAVALADLAIWEPLYP